MKGLPKFKKEYFARFSNKPVDIKPFDPHSTKVATKYLQTLNGLLEEFGLQAVHRGSTAFKISGKGDVEFGIYPSEENWFPVIGKLVNHYKGIGRLEEDYARFNDFVGQFEIEIILMKGHTALVDQKLTAYLKSHPEILKAYEKIKAKYSFSKQEYSIQKDKFLRDIVNQIPDD